MIKKFLFWLSKTNATAVFTVSLASNESSLLRTGDIFDIELRDADRVWTVAQGSLIVLEDVTN